MLTLPSDKNSPSSIDATPADKLAGEPFNLQTADVTFRTCDHVIFYLHKAILSIASPFFRDMFSLTQPMSCTGTPNHEVISITEDSQTFDILLRHFYPVDRPEFSTLASLIPVLEAAIKYQVVSTVSVLRKIMICFLKTDTLDIYATACRLNLEEEARLAAIEWKKTNSWDDSSPNFSSTAAGISYKGEISRVSAGAFFNLLRFMRMENAPESQFTTTPIDSARPTIFALPETSSCDVVLISTDSSKTPAHSVLIRLACGADLLSHPISHTSTTPDSDNCHPKNSPSTFQVDLDGRTLQVLLLLCYPQPDIHSIPSDILRDTAKAAVRFNVSRVVDLIRRHLRGRINKNPIAVYRIATSQDWKHEAKQALQRLLQDGVPKLTYCSDLDGASASEYKQFLMLEHQYEAAALEIVKKRNGLCSQEWKHIGSGVTLLRTAPYLAMVEGGSYSGCILCRQTGTGVVRPGCMCVRNALNTLRMNCGLLQVDLQVAATKIVSEIFS